MDPRDRQLLQVIQTDLPISERPFDALADRLGMDADALRERLRRLAADGVIRRIGPVFDSRRLGYVSTLVAAKVPPERLKQVAERASALPGVTHNYERRGPYNLWFTLAGRCEEEIRRSLDTLRQETGLAFHSLPALTVYKIRAVFDLTGDAAPCSAKPVPIPSGGEAKSPR